MPGFGKRKCFAVFTPPELRSLYGLSPSWFDGDGYLLIPLLPENWSASDTFLGETGLTPTFRRLGYQGPRRVIRGFEFSIFEGRAGVFYLLEHLASRAAGNPYIPCQVKDYVRPERADYAAAIAAQVEPMTLRTGAISEVALTQGLVGAGVRTFAGEGFTFKFQEDRDRNV